MQHCTFTVINQRPVRTPQFCPRDRSGDHCVYKYICLSDPPTCSFFSHPSNCCNQHFTSSRKNTHPWLKFDEVQAASCDARRVSRSLSELPSNSSRHPRGPSREHAPSLLPRRAGAWHKRARHCVLFPVQPSAAATSPQINGTASFRSRLVWQSMPTENSIQVARCGRGNAVAERKTTQAQPLVVHRKH